MDLELDDEPSVESKAQVRQVVASYSADAAECRMFLEMLGLTDQPQPPPGQCVECGEPLPITARTRRIGYAGLCSVHRKVGGA